ncbi:gliding motility protein GldM [Puteibacter caeruleilacunae]|nr:gliding motility protein GldM [Puteibacter caeruleilacunae]
MGAKYCPETPRQKMINMMYIVLTAMLALNVATEVLEAFKVVDMSLQKTISNFELRNAQIYDAFKGAYRENPKKVGEWKDKADSVRNQSRDLVAYIQGIKEELVKTSGYKVANPEEEVMVTADDAYIISGSGDTLIIRSQDDLNVPSEIMIAKKRAAELKAAIADYRDHMVSMIDNRNAGLKSTINQNMATPDPKRDIKEGDNPITWEIENFENKPLIAIVTLLSKLQIDTRNTESDMISYLFRQIDASSFKVSSIEPMVVAKSNYILLGEEYETQIFLTAVDATQKPDIYIENQKLEVKEGRGIWKFPTTSVGKRSWKGVVKYKDPMNNTITAPINGEYEVASPSISVSPTKMNVFYLGVDNPIDISVAGVPMSNVRPMVTNGTITETESGFVVKPKTEDISGKKTKVTLFAKLGDKEREMGSMDFRVKRVPDPIATIAGKNGGNLKLEDLEVEEGIYAMLKDFDFDLNFTVTRFNVTIQGTGGFSRTWPAKSNRFTQEQKKQLLRLKQGQFIIIENIQAKGDDGTLRDLAPINFKIR